MNVFHPALRRAEITKLLDLIQQSNNAMAFTNDQVAKLAVFRANNHGQKLRRSGDARQWVFNLMNQHFSHANGRAGG